MKHDIRRARSSRSLSAGSVVVAALCLGLGANPPPPQFDFHPLHPLWDPIPLAPFGSQQQGSFGKGVVGDVTGNGMDDAAIMVGSRILLLADPGRRKHHVSLDDAEAFHDLAAYPGGGGTHAGILTASNLGVSAWDWEGTLPVRRHTLDGPWTNADRIVTTDFPHTSEFLAMMVWEDLTDDVYPLLLWRQPGGTFVEFHFTPWDLPAPGQMAMLDFSEDPPPELAVGRPNGLEILRFNGAQDDWFPGLATIGVARCGKLGSHACVAWVRGDASTAHELVVRSETGQQLVLVLENERVTGLTSLEIPGGAWLAMRLGDGNVRVVQWTAVPFSFGPSILVELAPHVVSQASPLIAYFELSPCSAAPALLNFDDDTTTAWLSRGQPPLELPSPILLTHVELCNPGHCADSPAAHMTFDVDTVTGTTMRVATYAWQEVPAATWTGPVWWPEFVDVQSPSVTIPLLVPGPPEQPEALVVEAVLLAPQLGLQVGTAAVYYALVDPALVQPSELPDGHPSETFCLPTTIAPDYLQIGGSRGVFRLPGQINCQQSGCN